MLFKIGIALALFGVGMQLGFGAVILWEAFQARANQWLRQIDQLERD
jgi:hypothetical protein